MKNGQHGPWKKNRIPNQQIREAVELWQRIDSDHTLCNLYYIVYPNNNSQVSTHVSSHISRRIGKAKDSQSKTTINIILAAKIVRAIGRDPIEFDDL